jgi:NAD(P)H-dependent FMN reductase
MSKTKILLFAGSTRIGSVNHKLALSIAKSLEFVGSQHKEGTEITTISLNDYELPLYCQELECDGLPEKLIDFARLVNEHDGLVITSPEYNASLSPLLKNALDWLSRVENIDGQAVTPIKGKPVAIAACSPGSNGGIRGLSHLRDVLVNLGALILTEQLAVGNSLTAFDDDLTLTNERAKELCGELCTSLIRHAEYYKA